MAAASRPVLSREAHAEREVQGRHADGLDTKAGLVLGFAGVLAGLVAAKSSGRLVAGRLIGVLTAAVAVWALAPRDFPVLNFEGLYPKYLHQDPEFTERRLLAVKAKMLREGADFLRKKARRLKLAVILLLITIAPMAVGVLHPTEAGCSKCQTTTHSPKTTPPNPPTSRHPPTTQPPPTILTPSTSP